MLPGKTFEASLIAIQMSCFFHRFKFYVMIYVLSLISTPTLLNYFYTFK